MKPLLDSHYDEIAQAMILRYSDETAAHTVSITPDLNDMVLVSLTSAGDPVELELVTIDDETVAAAVRYATDNNLSLVGASFPKGTAA